MSRSVRTTVPACLTLALGFAFGSGAEGAPPPVLDRELFFGNPEIAAAQLSPDGRAIVFVAADTALIKRLYLRPLANPEARVIPGDANKQGAEILNQLPRRQAVEAMSALTAKLVRNDRPRGGT